MHPESSAKAKRDASSARELSASALLEEGSIFLVQVGSLPEIDLGKLSLSADSPSTNEAEADAETQKTPPKPAGLVGNIAVRKSGRAILQIGDVSYELLRGSESSFLQSLVSIDAAQKSMDEIAILTHKLVAVPHFPFIGEDPAK